MTVRSARPCCVALLLLCALVLAGADAASAQTTRYDPALRFRTLTTERFNIYYHAGEETLARRLARLAEEVAAQLEPRLGRPRGRVHVILVDQSDQSNGWATVIPYNLIELAAVPPAPHSLIGNTDDWLRTVFTHEYTHVVHLEKSGGWLGGLRRVFGRLPLFYPNLTLPDWQVEGIATYEESARTGRGRIPAEDFRMLLDRATAAGRFAPLDRATGAVIDWPSGNAPYLYGGYFHQYLARQYGEASLARLADETARRLPFLGSRAFSRVYGRSLGALWEEFENDTRARMRPSVDPELRTRLTQHGFTVTAPLFTRDGRLFYSLANPHRFPALMELPAEGTKPRQVATRYRGNRLTEAGDLLVFDQLEIVSDVDLQSDLYAVPLRGGAVRRLTRRARAADPDAAPDGTTIVCTVQQTDRRLLATMAVPAAGRMAAPVPLVSEPATEYSAPRWSPDGRTIAAVRQRLGGPSELVVVDVASRAVRIVTASSTGRHLFPTWLPDGRTILFSSNRRGDGFTLFAVDLQSGAVARLAGAGAGAQAPTLSPDGRRLVFVGYSADGYDLYSMPFDAPQWIAEAAGPLPAVAAPSASHITGAAPPALDRGAYRPWQTLAPRLWAPIVEWDDEDALIGGTTAGSDALGRHTYRVAAAWAINRNRPDVRFDYVYARWRPAVFASVSDEADLFRAGEIRSRELTIGATLPVRRVRWRSTVLAALLGSRDVVDCTSCDRPIDPRTRGALRVGWSASDAQAFGYSIGAEQGSSMTLTSELTRRWLGADADAGTFAADVRHYRRLYPRHAVVAVRAAGAASWGDERVRRAFSASGSGPQPGGFGFDAGAIGLLRGFDDADLVGSRAAVLNVDYRFPIAWVQRGFGTVPVFLRSVHGALFADAGHAWERAFALDHVRRSLGAELSIDTVFGGSYGLTLTAGVAWRRGVSGTRQETVAFGRIGRAF